MFTPDPWFNDDGSMYFGVTLTDERIQVFGPAINSRAQVFRAAGGVWDRVEGSWFFNRSNERRAVKAILKVYGSIPEHLFEQGRYSDSSTAGSDPSLAIALGGAGAAAALLFFFSMIWS